MQLSIIVIFHNMRREAARTLLSLSPTYQRGVEAEEYEVIAIDNGSGSPLDATSVTNLGANFRYIFHDTGSISPAEALNLGATMARAENLAFIVDGARMATPGLLRKTLDVLRMNSAAFVSSLSWHLGPDIQNRSMLDGYDQRREDALLETINWPQQGYDLFEISTLAPSSSSGFLGGFPPECSWLALPRRIFDDLGGYETRFQSSGGGLVNQDFRNRAVLYPDIHLFSLLGEGVFHQFHGGVSTNVMPEHHPIQKFRQEYQEIRGEEFRKFLPANVTYYGTMPNKARRFL